jgi:hypothetical protein
MMMNTRRWKEFDIMLDGIEPNCHTIGAMMDYKANLNERYWAYQESQFPDWQAFFERPNAPNGRPPVFLEREAWHNLIVNPDANPQEADRLLKLVSEPDRHKWFRSMNSSQALAQSVLGNLAIHGFLKDLAELRDDEGNVLLGKVQISSKQELSVSAKYLGYRRNTKRNCVG